MSEPRCAMRIGTICRAAATCSANCIWRRLALPWFILAFLAVVTLNSAVAIPEAVRGWALTGSKALLLAVTATAMRTRLDLLLEMGWQATVPVMLATLTSFGAALLFAVTAI